MKIYIHYKYSWSLYNLYEKRMQKLGAYDDLKKNPVQVK
jgi:hypothetical protein